MARQKKADPEKAADSRKLLEEVRAKFRQSLTELEMAKRNFSSTYVAEVMKEVAEYVPSEILEMNAIDFVQYLKTFKCDEDMQTPKCKPRNFKSITTPSGVSLQIPSMITPRVDGNVLRSRVSRQGEVLFSINGTPVIPKDSDFDPMVSKEQAKSVKELLEQDESKMSPATAKILKQLRMVLSKQSDERDENENYKLTATAAGDL